MVPIGSPLRWMNTFSIPADTRSAKRSEESPPISFLLKAMFASMFQLKPLWLMALNFAATSIPLFTTWPSLDHMLTKPLLEGMAVLCSKSRVFFQYKSAVRLTLPLQKAMSRPRLNWSVVSHFRFLFSAPRHNTSEKPLAMLPL